MVQSLSMDPDIPLDNNYITHFFVEPTETLTKTYHWPLS